MNRLIDERLSLFIERHKEQSFERILLSGSKGDERDISREGAIIIESRRRLKRKVAEWSSREDLYFPSLRSIEQSSSSTTASYKASLIVDKVVFDLTGGIGVDSYYLSKTNRVLYHIEQNRTLSQVAQLNFEALGVKNVHFINETIEVKTIENLLLSLPLKEFDKEEIHFYLDPSRRDSSGSRVRSLKEYEPNPLELIESLFQFGEAISIKLSPMEDISALLESFPNSYKISIISIDNECKELFLQLKVNSKRVAEEVEIESLIFRGETLHFKESYNLKEERECKPLLLENELKGYLYEPDVALLKGGAFKLIARRYQVEKLAPHTHLYCSSEVVENFPGKIFQIKEVAKFNKKTIGNLNQKYPKANIVTRNFPLSSNRLRGSLKIAEGGELSIFACSLSCGTKVLVVTERVRD